MLSQIYPQTNHPFSFELNKNLDIIILFHILFLNNSNTKEHTPKYALFSYLK